MNSAKYLFALWVGFFIYASLFILFGARGISAHRQLEKEQARQEANMESLLVLNRELENTTNSLLYDKDTMAVYAREQGYASASERFIRIVGLGSYQKVRTNPGSVVVMAQPQYAQDQTIRITAICTGITLLVCMAIFDLLRFLRDR